MLPETEPESPPNEFDFTEEESENLKLLLEDITLDITHKFYQPIHDKLIFYLQAGYKEKEVQGEMALTVSEMMAFKSQCPEGFWDRHFTSSRRWLGRKRANQLKTLQPHDLTILQTLDPEWSPKKININIDATDTALTDDERAHIKKIFPSEQKVIEAEVVKDEE